MRAFLQKMPLLQWLPAYRQGAFGGDLKAGLTVGVMVIPQGMAYALLAGMPPIYGLYTSVVPLILYALLGSSRHMASGSVALDMLIVSAGLSVLAVPGSEKYIALALLLTVMVGALQMAMGAARLGFLVNLLSRPVISGFTSAAALIIGLSQLKNLLGLELPSGSFHATLLQIVEHVGNLHLPSLIIGTVGILLLVVIRWWKPVLPGPLIAVAVGTVAVWYFALYDQGVAIVGDIPAGLPAFDFPALDLGDMRSLLPTAVTLAFVQFMSVISLGKLFAAKHRYTISPNRELLAIGSANFFGGMFGSIPVSGSFSRSAVNEQSGASTPLANLYAAVVIILTLLFLTPLFYYLPVPVFAAIIMVSAFGMIDVRELRLLFRAKLVDGYLALLTFATTLVIGIQEGVLVGIAASVVAILYRIGRPHVAVLGHLPGTRSFRDMERFPEAQLIDGILLLRIDASFAFTNAEFLRDMILEKSAPSDTSLKAVIIDASSVNDLDTTALSVLRMIAESLQERNIQLYFAGVKGPVRDVILKSGFRDLLESSHFFLSPHRAVKYLLEEWGQLGAYMDTVPTKKSESRYHGAGDM